jgi:hypothetical protein
VQIDLGDLIPEPIHELGRHPGGPGPALSRDAVRYVNS